MEAKSLPLNYTKRQTMKFIITKKPAASNINVPGRKELYKLHEDFDLNFEDSRGEKHRIHIPAGFVCDGSSIPRVLWTLIGLHKDGKNREPSLVHDWLYMHQGRIPERQYTRDEADRLYFDMLEAYGVPHTTAKRSFKGVQWFGSKHWRTIDDRLIKMNPHISSLQAIL